MLPNLITKIARYFFAIFLAISIIACNSSGIDTGSSLPSFKTVDLSGKTITQADLTGKVSIVNFWATTCTICMKEMPEMINVFKELNPEGLQFLSLAMSYDPPMSVIHYAKTRDLPFIVAMDSDGTAAKAFGKVEQTPTTFVIGKNGKVLKRYVGEPDWIEFRSVLKEALKANAS